MVALFIILNKKEYLEDILSIFIRHKIKGATIIESQGMASAIVNGDIQDIPLFGSLKTLLRGSHPYNKTIFSVLKSELVEKVVEEIRDLMEAERKTGSGFMFTVPVGNIYLFDEK
jgi:nitrogen regulatory protein PII